MSKVINSDLSVRRAVVLLALITLVVAIVGGIVIRVLDEKDFPSAGSGLWWSAQTITTVGYGDKVPSNTEGRLVAVVIMVTGLGFMSVVTATITAAFVESARRRRNLPDRITLEHIAMRLDQLEAKLVDQRLEADQHEGDRPDGERVPEGGQPRGAG